MSTRDIHVKNTFKYPSYFCISIKLLIIVVRYQLLLFLLFWFTAKGDHVHVLFN